MEQASAFCARCHRDVLVARPEPNHVLHATLTLFLCGAWIVPWILVVVLGERWRCQTCGGSDLQGVGGGVTVFKLALAALVGLVLVAAVILALAIGGALPTNLG